MLIMCIRMMRIVRVALFWINIHFGGCYFVVYSHGANDNLHNDVHWTLVPIQDDYILKHVYTSKFSSISMRTVASVMTSNPFTVIRVGHRFEFVVIQF